MRMRTARLMTLLLEVAGCTNSASPSRATFGGVVEVHYEAGNAAWKTSAEQTCRLQRQETPTAQPSTTQWYALRHGIAKQAQLACLAAQPHVLSVAQPL